MSGNTPPEKKLVLDLVRTRKILHVGFGKTATTVLQLSVLPKLAEQFGLEYIRVDDRRIRLHASQLNFGKAIKKPLDAQAGFIMSAEDIHSWDPFFWEEWADKNQQYFGSDCHVLITIREPQSYLTSVYLQMCVHEGNVQSANDLFLSHELYSPYIPSAKFAIDDFSYERIVGIYKSRFDALTVVKYEFLTEMSFLNEFFELSEKELLQYKRLFESERVNRSYSKRAVSVTFALQKYLNSIGLSLDASVARNSLACLKALREYQEGYATNMGGQDMPSRNLIQKLGLKMVSFLKWSSLMTRLDLHLPYHRFNLDFEALPQINLKKLGDEYDRKPKIETFRRGAGNIAVND